MKKLCLMFTVVLVIWITSSSANAHGRFDHFSFGINLGYPGFYGGYGFYDPFFTLLFTVIRLSLCPWRLLSLCSLRHRFIFNNKKRLRLYSNKATTGIIAKILKAIIRMLNSVLVDGCVLIPGHQFNNVHEV